MSANSRVGSGKVLLLAFTGLATQVVERADSGGHHLWAHLGVTRGGLDAAVAEQDLDDAHVGTVLQKVGAETVAQGVDGDAFAYARRARCFPARALQRFDVHVAALTPSREKPVFRRGVVWLSGGMLGAPPAF